MDSNYINVAPNGGGRVMTQQPEGFAGGIPVSHASGQVSESERKVAALIQQAVDARLRDVNTFLSQTKERIESLEQAFSDVMAHLQSQGQQGTGNGPLGHILSRDEQRMLLFLQQGLLSTDEARKVFGLGPSEIVAAKAKKVSRPAPVTAAPVAGDGEAPKRKRGRPRKNPLPETTPAVTDSDVLQELLTETE